MDSVRFIRDLIRIFVILIALELFSLLVGMFSSLDYIGGFRVVFGSVYVLFLPGFIWSCVFFALQGGDSDKKIGVIERIALSFVLSIAIVPLAVFYLSLIGVKISALTSFFVVALIIVVGLVVMGWRGKVFSKAKI